MSASRRVSALLANPAPVRPSPPCRELIQLADSWAPCCCQLDGFLLPRDPRDFPLPGRLGLEGMPSLHLLFSYQSLPLVSSLSTAAGGMPAEPPCRHLCHTNTRHYIFAGSHPGQSAQTLFLESIALPTSSEGRSCCAPYCPKIFRIQINLFCMSVPDPDLHVFCMPCWLRRISDAGPSLNIGNEYTCARYLAMLA